MKISAVYKITNTITGDFYIGSSKNVKHRLADHKCKSSWEKQPNSQLYNDMQKYGLDKFTFEILEEVEVEKLKESEQQFIETLKPTYNNIRANGLDIERYKETKRKSQNKYRQSEKGKKTQNKYNKSDKRKKTQRKAQRKYQNQLCCYNGETLTLDALRKRFERRGISNPTVEAKKYLINN